MLDRITPPFTPPAVLVDGDRADDHRPGDDLLPEGVHAEDVQAVADGRDNDRADQRGDDAALTAEDAGSTDDHRPDGEQLVAVATGGLDGCQAPGLDDEARPLSRPQIV